MEKELETQYFSRQAIWKGDPNLHGYEFLIKIPPFCHFDA
jgi:hypothetical protein